MAIVDHAVYATQPRSLQQQVGDYLKAAEPVSVPGEIYALIVPDSNLLSGAQVAADVYALLQGRRYDTVVLVASSHTGPFPRIHICSVDTYHTPLGELNVNDRVRHELCDEDDDIFLDDSGHFHPRGIDVQLPYLQTLLPTFDIVPIVMGDESPELCRELGHAIAEVSYNRRTLVIACADVTRGDTEQIDAFTAYFEAGDLSRLMMLLNGERVRMTGKGPVLVALTAALYRHPRKARVVRAVSPTADAPGYVGAVLWN